MYLNNYKNNNGIIVFSAIDNDMFASLFIEDNNQTMTLPKGKWKKVKTANETEIIEYSDSEGNRWDVSYGTKFPYTYEPLNRELLIALQTALNLEADSLENKIENIRPSLYELSKVRQESIIGNIMDDVYTMRKISNECNDELNPKVYDDEVMCENECVADDRNYGVKSSNNLGRIFNLLR